MPHTHPIGDEHPFNAVKALAEAQGFDALEILIIYDGALIRLFTSGPDVVFRLAGDPGSMIDRQRFDYYKHIKLDPAPADQMLDVIKTHIFDAGQPPAARSRGNRND